MSADSPTKLKAIGIIWTVRIGLKLVWFVYRSCSDVGKFAESLVSSKSSAYDGVDLFLCFHVGWPSALFLKLLNGILDDVDLILSM